MMEMKTAKLGNHNSIAIELVKTSMIRNFVLAMSNHLLMT